jgi:hypothetical protein
VAYQVHRDLLDSPKKVLDAAQAKIGNAGWGKRLLAERAWDGTWGGGLYQPKWRSTFYTLRLLSHLGLSRTHSLAVESCALLLDEGIQEDGGVSLWASAWKDVCVTAMLLRLAVYFGHERDERLDLMVDWLLAHQMKDGGWNCNDERPGARVSSFHTTLSALEGLGAYGVSASERMEEVKAALSRGHEYFLRHQLFLSERTGKVVRESFTRFSFPTRWFFDVLRVLEYWAHMSLPWDHRLAEAMAVLMKRQGNNGRWKNQNHHTGEEFFRLERTGKESPMNTLRALRVCRWAQGVGYDLGAHGDSK